MRVSGHVAGRSKHGLVLTYMISIHRQWIFADRLLSHSISNVFGIGFLAAANAQPASLLIKPVAVFQCKALSFQNRNRLESRGNESTFSFSLAIRADIWQTPFRIVLFRCWFSSTQNLPLPIFPLVQVNVLHLTDNQIGIGSAIFYFIMLIRSSSLRSMFSRLVIKK